MSTTDEKSDLEFWLCSQNLCGQLFPDGITAKYHSHKLLIEGQSFFQCGLCQRRFVTNDIMLSHKLQAHKNDKYLKVSHAVVLP